MAADEKPDLKETGLALSDLEDGAMVEGVFEEAPVLLVRQGGTIRAFSARCTHLGAPLAKGLLHEGTIRCPWHHARFDAQTGEAAGAPALGPLSCYDVERRGDRVHVVGKRRSQRPAPAAVPGRIVIVGTGAAGYACANELVRLGAGPTVTLMTAEGEAPYDRTFCSKQYLAGKAPREKLSLKRDDALREAGVTIRLGARVDAIDRTARELTLEGGERLPFETLVLALGGEPNRAETPGLESAHVLRSLEDADRLIEAAGEAKSAAVLGSSFIGLEVAASLTQRGLAVTVIAPNTVPLAKVLVEEIGAEVRAVHEGKGVSFRLGRKASSYADRTLTLDDGSTVQADLVVTGIGVSPRVGLAEAAGLDLASREEGGGVRVDGTLRTTDPAIFAVGDIASYPDIHSGRRQRVEHWVHAGRQGEHAARVILGQEKDFEDLPFFWTAHFDFGLRYVGHAASVESVAVDGAVADRNFAATIADGQGGKALVTAKRDPAALEREAAWEARSD